MRPNKNNHRRRNGSSSFQIKGISKISSSFQSLIKNSENLFLVMGFTLHIKLVLLDIGQAFVRGLLVLETMCLDAIRSGRALGPESESCTL